MQGTTLEFAEANCRYQLELSLNTIASGKQSPGSYYLVSMNYRVLAICALLRHADRDRFQEFLRKSGAARLEMLQIVATDTSVDPRLVCLSKDVAFGAAVAAGDISLAREISYLSPKRHFANIEYEDDFLFIRFLHAIISERKDYKLLENLLVRWEEVLEGQSSGNFDVCKALLDGQQKGFDRGFNSLMRYRTSQLKRYRSRWSHDKEMYATEGSIFIEGLAVLKIAELSGMQTDKEYKLIPSLARISSYKILPLGSWKSLPD
jgi:hypothetical protein